MRFHRILIAVLVLCFIVLGIRMFHIGNDIWIAFMLLAIVSSFLLVNDRAIYDEYVSFDKIDSNGYKWQDNWQVDSNGDDFIVLREEEADAVDKYEEGKKIIENHDADIKYKPDVTDEVVSDDDDEEIVINELF